MIILGLLVW